MSKIKDAYFDDLAYPAAPGFKDFGASRDAAKATISRAANLRDRVVDCLRRHGPATADEVADRIGASILGIRPRMSELFDIGIIEKTEERRKNASGMSASVWRLTR